MEIKTVGIVGLGKMGHAIAHRLNTGGFSVIGYDINAPSDEQNIRVSSLELLAQESDVIWIMVPAGKPVDDVLAQLVTHASRSTIIVDGGNSHFTDSQRRAQALEGQGFMFLDCGTSGGLDGQELGFCLMIGGNHNAYEKVIPLLRVIAAHEGYAYVGASGAGHYVKMVHNGIEYAVLQAYAEGFHVLAQGSFADKLDLAQIAQVWNHGSIIRSWILQLLYRVLMRKTNLATITGSIAESGMGAWTKQDAQMHNIPIPMLLEALHQRAWSRDTGGDFATKLVALLRHEFGGHEIQKI